MVTNHLDIIFLIYGFSFISLGLIVVASPKQGSMFTLARMTWLLASFAFLHGILEWLDLWRVLKGENNDLLVSRVALLLVSYLFLVEFGRRLLLDSLSQWGRFRYIFSKWLYLPLLASVFGCSIFSGDTLSGLQLGSRYFLGFTGSTMTSVGALLYYRTVVQLLALEESKHNLAWAFRLAACSFFAYGVLGGLIVPQAHWFPASVVNQNNFQALFHLPVQLFRALSAILIAISSSSILRIFHLEEIFK
jgi:hypothetical protein